MAHLKEAIHSRNLILFAQIDHSDLARGVGLTMQEAHVLIFGNPKGGTPLMIAPQERRTENQENQRPPG